MLKGTFKRCSTAEELSLWSPICTASLSSLAVWSTVLESPPPSLLPCSLGIQVDHQTFALRYTSSFLLRLAFCFVFFFFSSETNLCLRCIYHRTVLSWKYRKSLFLTKIHFKLNLNSIADTLKRILISVTALVPCTSISTGSSTPTKWNCSLGTTG